MRTQAIKTHQIFLVSNPYINKSERKVKLLMNNLLNTSCLSSKSIDQKPKMPTGKSRLKKQLRKSPIISMLELLVVFILELLIIRAKSPKISGKNKTIKISNKYSNSSGIVKKIILAIKTNSSIYKLKTCKKAITDLIYSKQ